jgi:SOS-response transcriptional repressor LexA
MASNPSLVAVRRHALAAAPQLPGRILGYRGFQVLRFVERYTSEHGREPTYSCICDELGIATKGEVSNIVSRLEVRGIFGRRDDGGPRIRLLGRR